MTAQYLPPKLKILHELYTDPSSSIFLTKNVDQLLRFARNTPGLRRLTRSDVLSYQARLGDLSRDREQRILRNRRRYLSHRRWKVWAPCHILLGDLFFIRSLNNTKYGHKVPCLILMDAFSRLVFICVLKNTTSKEVTSHLQEAFDFFGKPFKLFCSDRGLP